MTGTVNMGPPIGEVEDLGPAPIDRPDAPPVESEDNDDETVGGDDETRKPLPRPSGAKAERPTGKITIDEITDALLDEASRIHVGQLAMIDAGWRKVIDPKMKRRAALFVAAADMLGRLKPFQSDIRKLLHNAPKRK